MKLVDQYRPKSFDEIIGQVPMLTRLETLRQRGLAGRAYWISGPTGCGKTSLARLIAADVSNPIATTEVDAQDFSMGLVRDFENQCRCRPIGGGGWCFILNEAHGLSDKVTSRILTVLESDAAAISTWIFTTTDRGEQRFLNDSFDSGALLSRCVRLKLQSPPELDAAIWARKIAAEAGLDGQPLTSYVALVRRCERNLRAALQLIEAGEMLG